MKPANSLFSKYELTAAEEAQGFQLSPYTEAVLRNKAAEVAEEMLAEVFKAKLTDAQEREQIRYLQGQLDAFKYLLETHQVQTEAMQVAQQEEQEENPEE